MFFTSLSCRLDWSRRRIGWDGDGAGGQEPFGHGCVEVARHPAKPARGAGAAWFDCGLYRDEAGHGLAGLGDHHLLALGDALQELREVGPGGVNFDDGHGRDPAGLGRKATRFSGCRVAPARA